jgi:phenylacetate-CoA ligase
MYQWISRNILAKSLDYIRGTSTIKCLKMLEESQWWPRNDITALQNECLRKLIDHAYENVPYYKNIFKGQNLHPQDIRSTADLLKLPELNKSIIRSNFSELKSVNSSNKQLLRSYTGGSTGESLMFHSTKEDQVNWGYARALRARSWAGCDFGDKVVVFRVARQHVLKETKFIRQIRTSLERTIEIDPSTISKQTIESITEKIEKFNPCFFTGYPSAIYILACNFDSTRNPRFNLTAVITGGEQLYDYQKDLIEKVFGCSVFNNYSSWEVHNIACECSEHNGLHIASENTILEVVDEFGLPVPKGKEGRILLTNLHNYAMPLIRYDIGDLGVLSDTECSCGRGLPLISEISGRTCDVIKTKNKGAIPGMSIPWDFLARWGIKYFQIIQTDIDKLLIRVVPPNSINNKYISDLTKEIKQRYIPILGEVDILLECVEQIPASKSGKRKIVISNI